MITPTINRAVSGGNQLFLRLFLFACAMCCITVAANAAGRPYGGTAIHLWGLGSGVIADLDGDHIPDVASGIRTGRTREGYSYRVDFDLSGHPEARSFNVFSEDSNGLTIEAIDVDGDHDLDLVIRGRLSLRPIGIWLNDGSGRFTPGDFGTYALSVWLTEQFVQSSQTHRTPIGHFERRPQTAVIGQRTNLGPPPFLFREVHHALRNSSRIRFDVLRLRAPPLLTI